MSETEGHTDEKWRFLHVLELVGNMGKYGGPRWEYDDLGLEDMDRYGISPS